MSTKVIIELTSKDEDDVTAALLMVKCAIQNGCSADVRPVTEETAAEIASPQPGDGTVVAERSRVDDETQMLVKDAIQKRLVPDGEEQADDKHDAKNNRRKPASAREQIDKQVELAKSVNGGVQVYGKIVQGTVVVVEGVSKLFKYFT